MYKIKAKIKGISPLRHNKYHEDMKPTSTKISEEEKVQNAYDRSYYEESIGYYIPRHAIKACIAAIGARVKVGKRSAGKELKAIMLFEDEKFPVGTDKGNVYKEPVRIPPKTGSRVMQHWIVNKEWGIEFQAVILDDAFPAQAIKEAIEYAGLYNGLLDGRPEFGRFTLEGFEVINKKD